MNRVAKIYFKEHLAGFLKETESGYAFTYSLGYLDFDKAQPISMTLPLLPATYESKVLFPFFDGLIPEGWLLDVAVDSWKVNEKDRFGLLLACCKNCIGAVSIVPQEG